MSASSKKQIRAQQDAAKMTERQIAEQKEAKKLKLYTTAFVVALVALLVIAITIGVNQTITTSGMREKNTVAMTVGTNELSNADLNYFYIDTINNFYSQNGSYAALFGLDVSKPLNEQVTNQETGETWADDFLNSAKSNATAVYALCDAAAAAGHTMTEEEQASVESMVANMDAYGMMYGYSDGEGYLKAMYGPGATLEGFRSYVEKTVLANSYQTAFADSLTYEDADFRAAEAENFNKYSSYNYNYYYLDGSKFQQGGTTAEDGTVTYSDEEKAAALAAAEEAANTLMAAEIATIADFDAAVAALEINADNASAVSTRMNDQAYGYIPSAFAEWLTDSSRKEADMGLLENGFTAEDGTTTVNGYYVVRFESANDNTFALKNVRHILVNFQGGTTDSTTGVTTYTDEEKAAAMTAAEEILNEWKSGEATEASFAGLAAEKSGDPGSTASGGLYEDIYPGQMVANFEDWCFADGRKAGDTGIVETEYGCHVMYFVGDSDLTYRDYQIRNELTNADISEWYSNIVDNAVVTEGEVKYLNLGMVLGG